ncbi:hypothetical protein TSAR_002621 [Trichomalopsis sarcophagae]|uniref:Uncharacterized protein n=1 Tax=Trichomalopsis sarcophagae TaxID=543379 RepID=A0A232F325_9HYME|nr:hypothetical protein TSAR_002621 [Trichomalopsis sarcophagae]
MITFYKEGLLEIVRFYADKKVMKKIEFLYHTHVAVLPLVSRYIQTLVYEKINDPINTPNSHFKHRNNKLEFKRLPRKILPPENPLVSSDREDPRIYLPRLGRRTARKFLGNIGRIQRPNLPCDSECRRSAPNCLPPFSRLIYSFVGVRARSSRAEASVVVAAERLPLFVMRQRHSRDKPMMDRPSDDLDVLLRVSRGENREKKRIVPLLWLPGVGVDMGFFIEGCEAMLNGMFSRI